MKFLFSRKYNLYFVAPFLTFMGLLGLFLVQYKRGLLHQDSLKGLIAGIILSSWIIWKSIKNSDERVTDSQITRWALLGIVLSFIFRSLLNEQILASLGGVLLVSLGVFGFRQAYLRKGIFRIGRSRVKKV